MSLKADLSKRKRPSTPFTVTLADPAEKVEALNEAKRMLRQAEIKEDKAETKQRRAAVTRAGKALEKCFRTFDLVALEPDAYEELIDAHPPTPEEIQEAGKDPAQMPEWNAATFYPALLEACVDEDMTAEDWADFMQHRMSRGERRKLKYALVAVNESVRMPESMMLPKGLQGIGISS
jgi:hypothetical protein